MRIKALVPFSHLVELEADIVGLNVSDMKHQVIALAVKKFVKEFKKESILDIAHSMAPTTLDKVSLVFQEKV